MKEIAQGIAGAAGGVIGVIVSGFSLVLTLVTAIFLTLFLMIDLPRLIGAVDSLLDPARLGSLEPDVRADHHRRLADDARQHRDLDHLRHDLRRLGLDSRDAVTRS